MRACELPARSDSVNVTAHGPVSLEVGETVPAVTLVSGTYLNTLLIYPGIREGNVLRYVRASTVTTGTARRLRTNTA